jgi:hypothetical protein
VCASIVDATSPYHVAYAASDLVAAGADLHVEDSTIVGKVRTRTIPLASNTIFHARLGARDPLGRRKFCRLRCSRSRGAAGQ